MSKHIYLSGLPLLLQGWNCKLTQTGEYLEGSPVYHLPGYTLYFFIPIIGVRIRKFRGKWILQRDCDQYPSGIEKEKLKDIETPIGEWSYGAVVTEKPYSIWHRLKALLGFD